MERLTQRGIRYGSYVETSESIIYKSRSLYYLEHKLIDEEKRCEAHEGSPDFLIACKLADYEDLEEQGLLLRLLCKVGDIVYLPHRNRVTPYRITSITIYENRVVFKAFYAGDEEILELENISFQVKDIENMVFLTQAEAKKALKGMSN